MSNYEYSNIKYLVENSFTRSDVIKKLGLRVNGSSFRVLNKYLNKYDLKDSFLQTVKSKKVKIFKTTGLKTDDFINRFLKQDSLMASSRIRKYLIKFKLKEDMCEVCKLSEWNGNKITLQLHHMNGIHSDNRLENLQILCPNCHSQTSTFGTKNITFKKVEVKKYYCSCGNTMLKTSNECVVCYNKNRKTKVLLPPLSLLESQIAEHSFVAVGKLYNVSDNTIRKWLKKLRNNL